MKMHSRIGDYEVLGELGRGGMGHVYRVRNVISDRVDAMKVLLPDLAGRADLAARFLREIKLLAALDHPHIAALRTALEVDNQLVMILEYVEGQTVADRLNFGAIPVADALVFIDHVLNALDYAHAHGVVHRDIKPANMMLTSKGVVKLMDFGIARSTTDQTLTVAGATTGSLLYMSPEQVQGKEADERSDLYSVGISLYQMVTGQPPFKADTNFAVMAAHLQQMPKPPIELQPAVSPELNTIILKSIAKDPDQRFQSATEFRRALVAVRPTIAPTSSASPESTIIAAFPLTGASQVAAAGWSPSMPESGTPEGVVSPPAPVMRQGMRHPVAYMVLGGVLVIGALVGAIMYSQRAEANPPADEQTARQSADPLSNASNASASAATNEPNAAIAPGAPNSPNSPNAPGAPGAGAPGAGLTAVAGGSAAAGGVPGTGASPLATANPAASAGAAAGVSGSTSPGQPAAAPSGSPSSSGSPASPRGAGAASAPSAASRTPSNAGAGATAVVAGPKASAGTASAGAGPKPVAGGETPASAGPKPAAAAQAPAQGAAPAVDWDSLEDEIEQLTSRAVSINSSLDRMRQDQARMGLSLRGDVASRQENMNANLTRAREAVAQKNAARAPRLLRAASDDIEFLEKFLGREQAP